MGPYVNDDGVATLRMLAMAVVVLLGARLTYVVWVAIRTGTARMRRGRVRRRTQPWAYWTVVVVQAGFAVVCLVAAAWGLMR